MFEAFADLCTCRFSHDSRIPWLSIENYCISLGIDGILKEDLMYIIPRMDVALLEYQHKQRSKDK
jgi:hypothetical protein